ncbi:DUF4386 domain-containing protein [Frankia sp. ACN1ag]|uniref:DUF4386 domain-containing protein n=1 Tax=Frankia sp. ACN1ag TaxID=102891 RepID=UPI0009F8528F|nr:DUF4386 domain-containing protein [Frankia sp. ACN1ag]
MSTGQRATAVLLLVCAVCGAVGLTELRHTLDYPEVLSAPPADTLAVVREHWLAIGVGVVLAGVAAGLLLPITVGIVRLLPRGPHRPLLTVLGAAAGGAHLTGLLFWLITVPALARRAAIPAQADHASAVFDTARTLFGVMIGEVLACLLTASWTVVLLTRAARAGMILRPAARPALPRVAAIALTGWGGLAAGGVLGGVLLPFGVDAAVTGRVVGEFLWYLWLVGLAVAVGHLDPGLLAADPTAVAAAGGPASPTERRGDDGAHPGGGVSGLPVGSVPARAAHYPEGVPSPPIALPAGGPTPAAAVAGHDTRLCEPRSAGDAFFDAATEISWEDPPAVDGDGVRLDQADDGGTHREDPGGSGPADRAHAGAIVDPDRRPLRAATQPAGRLLGDDAPTDPAVDVPAGEHPDRATRSTPQDRRTRTGEKGGSGEAGETGETGETGGTGETGVAAREATGSRGPREATG